LLRFRLEERSQVNGRDWRELTTFAVKNPKPVQVESWKAQPSARFQLDKNVEVEVGEPVVRRETVYPNEIWEWLTVLPVRVTSHGQAVTNWSIRSGTVRDASGNFDFAPLSNTTSNDWRVYRMFRTLDPEKPWRFDANFALDSGFPASNLFSFTVPWPLWSTSQTNLVGGAPLRIGFVNRNTLNVEMINRPADTSLTFVKATDAEGRSLVNRGGWSSPQHGFLTDLKVSEPTQVHVTVAIHRTYPATFTLLPRFEPAAEESNRTQQGTR
jgi:hypothetical protein